MVLDGIQNVHAEIKTLRIREASIVFGFIFLCLPIFDMVNGFLVVRGFLTEGGLASPSQFGRASAAALLIYVAFKRRLPVTWLFIGGFGLLAELLAGFRSGESLHFVFGFVTIYRIAYFWLLFLVLSYYAKQDMRLLGQFLKYNVALISFSIILFGITGFGNSTYGWGFGSKGLFASGNGLGIYLGVASLSLLAMQYYRIYTKTSIVIYLLAFGGLMSIGSKTALLCALLLLCMGGWISRFRILIFPTFIMIFLLLMKDIMYLITIMFDVIILRFQKSDSVIEFLASGRLDYVRDAFITFAAQGPELIRWLFGAGAYISFQAPEAIVIYDTLETDVFDIFFMYGFLGLAVYFAMYIYGAMILRRHAYFFLIWILMLMHSILAGHIIFNGMSLTMVAFLLAIGSKLTTARSGKQRVNRTVIAGPL